MPKKRPTNELSDFVRVPESIRTQLARLFGAASSEAKVTRRTPKAWRRTLSKVLDEFEQYLFENVRTDDLHNFMLYSGIYAAREALKTDDFWPGYTEGITRVAFMLMGDYPDHRQRKFGAKPRDHYSLRAFRTQVWQQSDLQRLNTLLMVPRFGLPKLSTNPEDLWNEYKRQLGSDWTPKEFLEWYRTEHPQDYAKIFR